MKARLDAAELRLAQLTSGDSSGNDGSWVVVEVDPAGKRITYFILLSFSILLLYFFLSFFPLRTVLCSSLSPSYPICCAI